MVLSSLEFLDSPALWLTTRFRLGSLPCLSVDTELRNIFVGDKGLNCVACHNFNGKPSLGLKGLDLEGSELNWKEKREIYIGPHMQDLMDQLVNMHDPMYY